MIPFLLQLIVVLLIAGVLLWALTQFPAIDPTIKQIVKVIIIVIVAIWAIWLIAGLFGVGSPWYTPPVRR